ncbi:MAG: AmmeMemoRadiSam system protein B [Kiritimatiellales bacterium]|nr:AmmeMemoRadiSam system protein B [Kiritimatiellales bacterium]
MKTEKKVLQSKLAGTWYSANPDQLGAELDGYLANVKQEKLENIMAVLLPHAGYRFSGQVAAYGIKQLEGRSFKRVVVLGPTHRVSMAGIVSIPDISHLQTPLGAQELDREFISKLWKHSEFQSHMQAHADEHSVQIEVPLLQRVLGDFKLVPIVVGQMDERAARKIADVLLQNIDSETLIVVSSDFTHYGQNFGYLPFKDDIQENLRKLDLDAFKKIEQKDLPGFIGYVDSTGATICGRCPISILLAMLPDNAGVHLLNYDTSGNLTGDWSHCVSYVSAAFTGSWQKKEPASAADEELLSDTDKANLLKLARGTIEYYMDNGKKPKPADIGVEVTPGMETVMGTFVTLHQNGQLRGCIGEIFPSRELYKAVIERAIDSTVNDHRFRPVKKDEVAGLHIEISALSPPKPVGSWKDIVIGKHGMTLSKNGRGAVFLPQVAPEQGWGIEETLTHLAMKAGLGANDWREGCQYQVFEAIVFSEDHK